MRRVLLVGLDPATVDFSDPALPPGMTAEKIHAGIKFALADMNGRGWLTDNCFINPDETAVPTVERRLADAHYDCVVVGAGSACQPADWLCSKPWSTPFTAVRRKRPLHLTVVPKTPARRLRGGSETRAQSAMNPTIVIRQCAVETSVHWDSRQRPVTSRSCVAKAAIGWRHTLIGRMAYPSPGRTNSSRHFDNEWSRYANPDQ